VISYTHVEQMSLTLPYGIIESLIISFVVLVIVNIDMSFDILLFPANNS